MEYRAPLGHCDREHDYRIAWMTCVEQIQFTGVFGASVSNSASLFRETTCRA